MAEVAWQLGWDRVKQTSSVLMARQAEVVGSVLDLARWGLLAQPSKDQLAPGLVLGRRLGSLWASAGVLVRLSYWAERSCWDLEYWVDLVAWFFLVNNLP